MKINGVVVLYNPNYTISDNIKSYLDGIEKLYVVDNSEIKNDILIEDILKISSKCIYVDNNGNKGIADALNVGANMAIQDDAKWLLTMDQDSRYEDNSLDILIHYVRNNNTSKLGILSPFHLTKHLDYKKEDKIIDELTVMTSGNLLNLDAYKNIGEFEEKYFIDYVDHEYCLRLKKSGYSIKVHKNSILIHELGNGEFFNFFGKKIGYTNHNHIRRYYITRNRLDVITRYIFVNTMFCLKEFKAFIFEWIKIILFEQNKIKKQKAILLGTFDFFKNKYGKYNEK